MRAQSAGPRNFRSRLARIAGMLQYTWQRRLPFGLLSVRFLLPTSNRWIQLHRDLPLAPETSHRMFRAISNVWLVLQWLTWSAWRMTNTAAKNQGALAQEAGANTPARQRIDLLRLALLHAIPPQAYYQYQLWNVSHDAMWSFVYDNELPQFHQIHNGNMQGDGARLLADKWQFANHAAAAGIAVTPTLQQLHRGQHDVLLALLQQHKTVFCKPRFGSASRGAFAAHAGDNLLTASRRADDHLVIAPLKESARLTGDVALDRVRQLLAGDDYIVQPLLQNHPVMQALCRASGNEFDDVITVRVLSHRHKGNRNSNDNRAFDLWCAYLEIPLQWGATRRYALVALDCTTGMTRTDDDNWHYRNLRQQQPQLLAGAASTAIPFWPQICEQALRAHALVHDINIVAWDFVVTAERALLLEGNINWRVSAPQMLFGPLLPQLFPQ